MARSYNKITTIRLFPNSDGAAKFSNSKWTPYKDGSASDLHFRGTAQYSVRAFENDDGSLGVQISEITEKYGTDSITDGISQPGMKQVGEAMQAKHVPDSAINLDDDIPF
jgi:hypothetical protein